MTPIDSYAGASMTADPHGTIVCRANAAEQLIFCDLDPSVVESARKTLPVAKDRKDQLYDRLSKKSA
jgi:predicted amidohydrolase